MALLQDGIDALQRLKEEKVFKEAHLILQKREWVLSGRSIRTAPVGGSMRNGCLNWEGGGKGGESLHGPPLSIE